MILAFWKVLGPRWNFDGFWDAPIDHPWEKAPGSVKVLSYIRALLAVTKHQLADSRTATGQDTRLADRQLETG